MKDKHLLIPEDSELLKHIYAKADEHLRIDKNFMAIFLGFKFLFYFFFSTFAYIMLYKMENPFLFVLCFIVYGFSAVLFCFNFAHDFSHNTVFKNKALNNFGFTVLYTLVGAHAEAWKKRHVHSHHYAPNVEGYDSDLKISDIIRVIPGSDFKWYNRFQHWYAPFAYTAYSLFWVFIKDFVILFSKDEYAEEKKLKYHLSFWMQKIVYAAYLFVLPLLFAKHSWYIVLAGFLLMHLSQSVFLLFTFFITHHVEKTAYPSADKNGNINSSWLMNQVKSSNDFYPFSPIANFFFGGFNNHIAHHLFPHIHHVHYPQLSRILYRVLAEKNIYPNRTIYFGGVISHLKLLKRMSINDVPIISKLCASRIVLKNGEIIKNCGVRAIDYSRIVYERCGRIYDEMIGAVERIEICDGTMRAVFFDEKNKPEIGSYVY